MTERLVIREQPKITVEPGRVLEVDIAAGEEVIERNLPAMVLEVDRLMVRIELPGSHTYDLPRKLVELGSAGMFRFHEPGRGRNRVDKA